MKRKPDLIEGQFDAAGRKLFADDCPRRYTGPIERADGTRPFNGYLWPSESWWAYHEPGRQNWDSRVHFGIVALWDGRWAVSGMVQTIERDDRRYSWERKPGQLRRHNCFATREQAIRTAAADLLRQLRLARRSKDFGNRLARDGQHWVDACNWVRQTVHREAGHRCRPPRLATYTPPPAAPAPSLAADLPLFGGELEAA